MRAYEGFIAAVAEAGIQIMAGPLYSPVGCLPGRRRTTDSGRGLSTAISNSATHLKRRNVTIAVEP